MKTLIRLEITAHPAQPQVHVLLGALPGAAVPAHQRAPATDQKVDGTGLTVPTYFMVAMAAFGAMTAVLMGNSERIAKEREKGWVRQLRLTALPGPRLRPRQDRLARPRSACPSIVIVFAGRRAVKDVRLDAWQWLALPARSGPAASSSPRSASPSATSPPRDAVRPITMIIYFGLSLLGGLWMPIDDLPAVAAEHRRAGCPRTPYAALGQAIESGRRAARQGHRRPRRLLAALRGRQRPGCTARTP